MKVKYKRMLEGMSRKEKALPKRRLKKNWSVYILRCSDGTLYTGVTNDVKRRLKMHNAGTAAKYTRTRNPVNLVYRKGRLTRAQALSREYAIKALSKQEKENLVKQ